MSEEVATTPALVPARRPSGHAGQLVLLRHGESEWNRDRRFTGWTDVDLSAAGELEAAQAGERLRGEGLVFDMCFSSILRRATHTAEIVLRTMQLENLAIEQTWRLNERHYGALQGMHTWRAMCRFGPLAVLRCQLQFAVRPPALAPGDPRFPGFDPRYAAVSAEELPRTESYADTLVRLRPYWMERIAPELARGRRIIVVSHKNTLRALVTLIEGRAEADVRTISVPTGAPLVFVPDEATPERWRRLTDHGARSP
jgi:2,3-bisphosphoglycerate-dependent phosphoglycerate mutase